MNKQQLLLQATQLALAGEWDKAHEIVQDMNDSEACWIHAVLHKIEGDEWNSRYWYALSQHQYEQFDDTELELKSIASRLNDE